MMEEQNIQDTTIVDQSTENTMSVTEQVGTSDETATEVNSFENSETIPDNSPKFEPPVNAEALANQKVEFSNLESQIMAINGAINAETDFRTLRKNIVSLKEQVISLFLIPIAEKDKLVNHLQEIYEKLSEKQEEVKEELNKVFDENLKAFEAKFEEEIKKVSELALFKEARKILANIQTELKKVKLRQSDKDRFFKSIQDVYDSINKKETDERESYEMECSNNFLMVKPKVEHILSFVEKSEKFNESRKKLIEIQNEIKELKLKKNNRDELFQSIRETFNKLNERQDQQRESFSKESTENYDKILPAVNQAIEFAANPSNFTTARQTLINIQKELKELTLSKSQRDELFGKIREVFNGLNDQQDENREEFENESNTNFAKLEIKVNEALMNVEYSNDFRDIREGLLTVQDETKILKLKRNQRNDLLTKIRLGFEKFDKKRNEYLGNKKEEKSKKLTSILDNLNHKLTRLSEAIGSDEIALNDLKEKLNNASEEEKVNLNILISEQEAKLNEKLETKKSNEERIADINNELSNLK